MQVFYRMGLEGVMWTYLRACELFLVMWLDSDARGFLEKAIKKGHIREVERPAAHCLEIGERLLL